MNATEKAIETRLGHLRVLQSKWPCDDRQAELERLEARDNQAVLNALLCHVRSLNEKNRLWPLGPELARERAECCVEIDRLQAEQRAQP